MKDTRTDATDPILKIVMVFILFGMLASLYINSRTIREVHMTSNTYCNNLRHRSQTMIVEFHKLAEQEKVKLTSKNIVPIDKQYHIVFRRTLQQISDDFAKVSLTPTLCIQ